MQLDAMALKGGKHSERGERKRVRKHTLIEVAWSVCVDGEDVEVRAREPIGLHALVQPALPSCGN